MKIFQYLVVATLVLFTYSCEKETEGVSKITNYVTFDLTGGSVVTFPQGTYAEPGFKAMEGTVDVTNDVVVEDNVNGNQIGLYTVTYSAVNAQGFPSSTVRTVIIYSPTAPATDISGAYKSSVARVSPARSFSNLNVTITKVAPGFFFCSDFLGGFYDQGSNYKYGPNYATNGYFLLNANNTLSLVSSHNNGWGDSLNSMSNGLYTPATNTVSWQVSYTTVPYLFNVTLVKQ